MNLNKYFVSKVDIDLKYLAGFFDGEGSVAVYSNSDHRGYCLRFQLGQNVSPQSTIIAEFLKKTYGVHLHVSGTLSGKKKYNMALSGWKAAFLLEQLKPYLIIKRDQVELALEWHYKKPKIQRLATGRIAKFPKKYFTYSKKVAAKLKAMKQ
jgi:hypothetical protein